MLLGEYEHTLDDKNRLTLPAKLREQLGEEVVVTRGLDGCLCRLFPAGVRASSPSASGRSTPSAPRPARCSASSSPAREPRRARPAGPDRDSRAAARGGQGSGASVTVAGVYDHLEIWDRAAWREQLHAGRRERGRCCRASCQPKLITSPSSPTRCSRALAPAAGRHDRRLHLRRRAGTPSCCSAASAARAS